MGIYRTPQTLDEVVIGHIASMRSYADTLDESGWPLVTRAAVVARVRKCAAEVERAQAVIKLRNAAPTAQTVQPPCPEGNALALNV